MSSPVRIEIDEGSGFCHGVVRAIAKAEDALQSHPTLYCIGDIVHNNVEVERLAAKGLRTITHDDLTQLGGAKVLLRAHGEPPTTYEAAQRLGIEIIDATCPVVLKLQQRIRRTYLKYGKETQIVIYGKKGHAEVNGLVGQTEGTAIVVESPNSLDQIDFGRPIELYSQTTMSVEGFDNIVDAITRRRYALFAARCCSLLPIPPFNHYDTICRQVANRVDHLRNFANAHDVILFVCGEKSSNGKVLYQHCLSVNPSSYMLARAEDVNLDWLKDATSIGICGATSTPRWLMEDVRDNIDKKLNSK